MDSEALRTFLAVCRAGSVTRASRALHRSQPAISRRIALLEQDLGVPLFERTRGGVVPSQAGRALLPHAERAAAALEDCRVAIRALQGGAGGPVSVAAVGTLASTELTVVLQRFAGEHPDVDLALRTATSAEVSELVRRGEVTMGLRYLHDDSADLLCRALDPERLVVACSPRHRLAGRRVASLVELRAERWFAFPQKQGSRTAREEAAGNLFAQFLVRGVGALSWAAIDSLTSQKRLIEAGFGLGLLPESSIQEERERGLIATIRVADLRAENPIYLVVRKGGYLSPAARDLLGLLAAHPVARTSRTRRSRRRSKR